MLTLSMLFIRFILYYCISTRLYITVEKRIEPYTLIIRLSFTLFDTNSLL